MRDPSKCFAERTNEAFATKNKRYDASVPAADTTRWLEASCRCEKRPVVKEDGSLQSTEPGALETFIPCKEINGERRI